MTYGAALYPQHHCAHHFCPSFLSPSQIGIDIALLPSRLSTKISLSDVDPVADTSPIDRDVPDSDHSSEQAQAKETGKAIQAQTERDLQAGNSKKLFQRADRMKVEKKRGKEELRQRSPEMECSCS